jgi:ethanolamine utilization protein EutN
VILGRVVGTVVATQKHKKYEGSKLLMVQPVDLAGGDTGEELIAVDSVGAGAGETVLIVQEGRSTSLAMATDLAPANAAIIGIVDHVDLHD